MVAAISRSVAVSLTFNKTVAIPAMMWYLLVLQGGHELLESLYDHYYTPPDLFKFTDETEQAR